MTDLDIALAALNKAGSLAHHRHEAAKRITTSR